MIDFDTARTAKEARSWQNLQEAIDELATALHRCRIGYHLYPEGISGLPLLPGTIVTGSGATAVALAVREEQRAQGGVRLPQDRPVRLLAK